MNKILIALSLWLILPLSALGANDNSLVTQIVENNESVKAAKLKMNSDVLQMKIEGNLPDPEAELEILAKPINSLELTVSETIEWPGVYAMRRNSRKHRIDATQYLYESECLEVAKEARLTYAELIKVNAKISRSSQLRSAIDSILAKVTRSDLKTNFSVLDISKLKIESFDIASDISSMEIQRQVLIANLVQLNGGKQLDHVDLECRDYPISLMPEDYYISSYYDSPEYKALLATLQSADYDVKASKMSWWPNITLGYKFNREAGINAHGAVVGVSIPIFSNRGKVKAAQSVNEANEFSKAFAGRKGEADVRKCYQAVVKTQMAISDYTNRLNYGEVVAYLNKALAEKSITIVEYLTEHQYVLNAQQKLDDMKADLAEKYIELSKYVSL